MKKPVWKVIGIGAAVLALLTAWAVVTAVRDLENPNELWKVVQGCVAAKRHGHTLRAGCLAVDERHKVAVLPGIFGSAHVLVVPTIRLTGIEDPRLLDPATPNYFALAWDEGRRYLPARAAKDPTRVGLAVNSVPGRSQDQLHIHVACLRRSVRRRLREDAPHIGSTWSSPLLPWGVQRYRIIRIDAPTLAHVNVFALIRRIPGAAANIGSQTILVTGAPANRGRLGFYVLDDYAHDTPDGPDTGHAEDLLDESCR